MLNALGAHLVRHVVEDAVQLHVFVGGLLAIEAGILEDDAEALACLALLHPGIETVEMDSTCSWAAAVWSAS